jgi:uncharacterized protein GlcG (DUF336 family)
MDAAPLLSVGVAADKAWTVAAFGKPTHWWAELISAEPALSALANGRRLMPVPGGVPVMHEGRMVGALGVSGGSSEQDRHIAERAARADSRLTKEAMESAIRGYFAACNAADPAAIASYFTSEAVHYFPPGMYEGPFVGAETIATRWVEAVAELGSVWTVDRVMADPVSAQAVIEWTHFKTKAGKMLRGDEWYRFHPETGLITEIRAYYASPQAPQLDRLELGGFDYRGRGYPVEVPGSERADQGIRRAQGP